MNSSQYKIVFSLKLFHSYFEGGISDSWIYKPESLTDYFMTKYGFKMDLTPTGFDLYANTQETLSDYLNYISKSVDQDYFEFTISSSSPLIYMVTEVPIYEVGFYAYNNQNKNNKIDNNSVRLVGTWTPSEDSNIFARVKINFDQVINFSKSNMNPIYEIKAEARSTQWQYFIINNSGLEINNLEIKGKSDIPFEGPEKIILPNGQPSLKFNSGTSMIPLAEIPSNIFDLVSVKARDENIRSNNKIIIKGLPNPSPDQFGKIENNGNTLMTSPMYVYV